MKLTNRLNLPDAFVAAVAGDPYSPGTPLPNTKGVYSVTTLIGPPQIKRLLDQHEDELSEDVSDRVWALLGRSVHKMLEHSAGTSEVTEKRLYAELDGYTVSGQTDNLDVRKHELFDWKTTSAWSVKAGLREDWIRQTNAYAWLAAENGIQVDKLFIAAILRDWSRTERMRYAPTYPEAPVVVLPVPSMPIHAVRNYLQERLMLHTAKTVADCTAAERWERPGKWALMKQGRMSAVKLEDTAEALMAYAQDKGLAVGEQDSAGHWLVERPGEFVRCMDYCPVRSVCPQLKREGLVPNE